MGAEFREQAKVFKALGDPKRLRFLYKGIIINHNKNRANLH